MKIPPKEVSKRWTKGQGPGGQNRNKLETCCVLTHIPTGVESVGDERTRRESYRTAYRGLCKKLETRKATEEAMQRKTRRDYAIKNTKRIRTYDYSRGVVTDHRTGKTASIKDVIGKGRLDLLQ